MEQGGSHSKLEGMWKIIPLGACAEPGASATSVARITSTIRRMFARPARVNLHKTTCQFIELLGIMECVFSAALAVVHVYMYVVSC